MTRSWTRLVRRAASALGCAAFTVLSANPARAQSLDGGPSGSDSKVSRVHYGLGFGGGPGPLGGVGGWWLHVFGAMNVSLGRSWELQLEPGLMRGWSSIPAGDPNAHAIGPGLGTLMVGDMVIANEEKYDVTLLVVRALVGYRFGRVFVLRAGPLTGYGTGTVTTTNCGKTTSRGFPAGGAVAPTFLLGMGFEIAVQVDMEYVPLARCMPSHLTNTVYEPPPRMEQNNEGNASLSLRAAFVGF